MRWESLFVDSASVGIWVLSRVSRFRIVRFYHFRETLEGLSLLGHVTLSSRKYSPIDPHPFEFDVDFGEPKHIDYCPVFSYY